MGAAARPLLLTGFTPFGGASANPSAILLEQLAGERFGPDHTPVEPLLLPVSFRRAQRPLAARLSNRQLPRPRAVLALGLAGNRETISIERVAINLIDARIPDEDRSQPIDVPVRRGGLPARFATLPVKAMLARARAHDLPVTQSFSAGSFVCNALFFHLLTLLAGTRIPAGFVHVPWLPGQSPDPHAPSLPLATQLACLRVLITAVLTQDSLPRDVRLAAGVES